jgi:phosphoribosylaminoimidazole-succinocarboxamide synthase
MGMTTTKAVTTTDLPGLKLLRRGKVRDVYDLGDKLLIVATDRLSAFDYILPTPIPEKGKLLTAISAHWFKSTKGQVPNHFITDELPYIQKVVGDSVTLDPAIFDGRTTLAYKAERIDVECVARGYIAGSGWKEYKAGGMVCGHRLPAGLQEASKLPEPIFTPASKNDHGHDENISREKCAQLIGPELTQELERLTLKLYNYASAKMLTKGLILADTKFEFGRKDGQLIVIDEMLTPDSSRVWDQKTYKQGSSPASYDKQFVRDYLERVGWNKQPPVPELPAEVAEGTSRRYLEFYERLLK